MLGNEKNLDCWSETFGEVNNEEFLEPLDSNLPIGPAEATSPSLANVSGCFLHDSPANA